MTESRRNARSVLHRSSVSKRHFVYQELTDSGKAIKKKNRSNEKIKKRSRKINRN